MLGGGALARLGKQLATGLADVGRRGGKPSSRCCCWCYSAGGVARLTQTKGAQRWASRRWRVRRRWCLVGWPATGSGEAGRARCGRRARSTTAMCSKPGDSVTVVIDAVIFKDVVGLEKANSQASRCWSGVSGRPGDFRHHRGGQVGGADPAGGGRGIEPVGRYSRTVSGRLTPLVPFIDRVRAQTCASGWCRLRNRWSPRQLDAEHRHRRLLQVTVPQAAVYEFTNYIVGVDHTTTTPGNVVGGMTLEQLTFA